MSAKTGKLRHSGIKVNELQKTTDSVIAAIFVVLVVAIVCAGVIYYYRGAAGKLESELGGIEQLNKELASETRQLQKRVASHSAGIKAVGGSIGKSLKRVEHVYTDIEEATIDTDRAGRLIKECQDIIEAVKAQRQN